MKVLVTGAAGFIGMHVAQRLLGRGDTVVGLDNLNDYYDVNLKLARLAELQKDPAFAFHRIDIVDPTALEHLIAKEGFESIVHLAAQAGVRYSLTNPHAYIQSNITGFLNVLEACRKHPVKHLVYASSSSVYGGNTKLPFVETDNVDHPVSLYAVTKKSNELMAHSYSHLFGIPTTGLRFFTVYGPWGRPDMALFIFTRAILAGQPIDIFNHGNMQRDFTYIDDVAQGVVAMLDRPPVANADFSAMSDPAHSWAPYQVLNIGNNGPAALLDYVDAIERSLRRKAERNYLPMQPGDVQATFADTSLLTRSTGVAPKTTIESGVQRFVDWYRAYYAQ
ncbi:MAG: NAD-dependent epimerase [Burkholderiaceae bacterium]